MTNKRGDNENIDFLDIPDRPYRSETFFGKGGNAVDEAQSFCKIIVVGKWEKFFIWFWRDNPIDPYGAINFKRDDLLHAKLKQVPKESFKHYLRYLKTKNKLYYFRSNRLYLEKS